MRTETAIMADTLNTRFINCLYYKIIVVADVVLK